MADSDFTFPADVDPGAEAAASVADFIRAKAVPMVGDTCGACLGTGRLRLLRLTGMTGGTTPCCFCGGTGVIRKGDGDVAR